MQNYELLYIIHPDLEATLEKITSKVKNFITLSEGKTEKEDVWGKRKLAYEIKKGDFGIYILLNFSLAPEKLNKLLKELNLQEEILRFLVTKRPEKVKVSIKKEAKESAFAIPEVTTEAKPGVVEEVKKEKKVEKEPKEVKKKVKEVTKEKEKEIEVVKPKKVKKPKKEKPKAPETSEEERLKKIDEKLKQILGEGQK